MRHKTMMRHKFMSQVLAQTRKPLATVVAATRDFTGLGILQEAQVAS
jgi:hypothetical protein